MCFSLLIMLRPFNLKATNQQQEQRPVGAESVLFAAAPPTGIRPPPRPLALGGKLVAVRPSPGDRRRAPSLPLPSDFPREGGRGGNSALYFLHSAVRLRCNGIRAARRRSGGGRVMEALGAAYRAEVEGNVKSEIP